MFQFLYLSVRASFLPINISIFESFSQCFRPETASSTPIPNSISFVTFMSFFPQIVSIQKPVWINKLNTYDYLCM